MTKTLIALGLLNVPLLLGCAHDNRAAGATTLTSAGVLAAQPVNPSAIETITIERCEREERCSNIGAGRKYATREVCMEQVRSDNMNALTNASCPYGIDAQKLNACLAEVRWERCNHPFDTLNRFNACQRQRLCPR